MLKREGRRNNRLNNRCEDELKNEQFKTQNFVWGNPKLVEGYGGKNDD